MKVNVIIMPRGAGKTRLLHDWAQSKCLQWSTRKLGYGCSYHVSQDKKFVGIDEYYPEDSIYKLLELSVYGVEEVLVTATPHGDLDENDYVISLQDLLRKFEGCGTISSTPNKIHKYVFHSIPNAFEIMLLKYQLGFK